VSWVGAYDLTGNVFEWTHDWYDANYYKQRLQDNPIGPASGRSYAARGGSWKSIPSASRASARNSFGADYRAFTLGLRVVSAAG
jgi:formylglycine-generating enzyme required for sulfatase activity